MKSLFRPPYHLCARSTLTLMLLFRSCCSAALVLPQPWLPVRFQYYRCCFSIWCFSHRWYLLWPLSSGTCGKTRSHCCAANGMTKPATGTTPRQEAKPPAFYLWCGKRTPSFSYGDELPPPAGAIRLTFYTVCDAM